MKLSSTGKLPVTYYKDSFYAPRFIKHIDEGLKKAISEGSIGLSEGTKFANDFKTMLSASACHIEDWEIPTNESYDKEMVDEKNTPYKTIEEIVFSRFGKSKETLLSQREIGQHNEQE